MGSYLSVSFEFDAKHLTSKLLAPVFQSHLFQPMAIGSLDTDTNGNNWFLAGYALEDFINKTIPPVRYKPLASIELGAKPNDEEYFYLSSLAKDLAETVLPIKALSPFESQDIASGITYLTAAGLKVSTLAYLDAWLERFHRWSITVYGTLSLSVHNDKQSVWKKAFRSLTASTDPGYPLLIIDITTFPRLPETIIVRLYSSSQVWLRGTQEYHPAMGPEEADVNLDNLVSLAQLIQQDQLNQSSPLSLTLKGSVFHREAVRIETAFARLGSLSVEKG